MADAEPDSEGNEKSSTHPPPQLTDMPLGIMNRIGSHLQPHNVVRLGQALTTSTGIQFRLGHMKDYRDYAASKIQSIQRTPVLKHSPGGRSIQKWIKIYLIT